MNLNNITNSYIQCLEPGYFDKIPKTVWAAIAISLATTGGDRLNEATLAIIKEWRALYYNGIVKQKPPKEEIL